MSDCMTRRERLIAAFKGEAVDRIPVSCYELDSFDNATLRQDPGYARLLDHVWEEADLLYPWGPGSKSAGIGYFMTATTDCEVQNQETQEGDRRLRKTTIQTPKGPISSLTTTVPGILTTWTIEHFLKTDEDIERFFSIPHVPAVPDCSHFAETDRRIGERGLLHISLADPLCMAADLFEFGEYTVRALTDQGTFRRILDLAWERIHRHLALVLEAGVFGVFRICGPEYATPPYRPPELFDAYVVPYVAPMCKMIREAGSFPRVHCHGKIARVLDSIAATKPDAIDPLEPPPDGDLCLSEAVRRVGDRITLMGNIETREIEFLPEDQMRHRVREAMEVGVKARGFVLTPTACPAGSSLSATAERNYRIMMDEAKR